MIRFPTRPNLDAHDRAPYLGEPARARPCRCANAWLDHEHSCVRCGRWPAWVIGEAWAEQARRLRGGSWAGRAAARRLELAR